MTTPLPSPEKASWLTWLLRLNAKLSVWAAMLSWRRLVALGLIVLIASTWIGETLQLRHEREPHARVARKAGEQAGATSSNDGCSDGEIRIGGKPGMVICGPAGEADGAAPQETIRRTLGGWVGDVASAALIAFFAYLIAAKIIVRKTAEADAKLRVATDSADQEAMQRQLVQARLKLLQAQVEPHFLFNTLAAVDYLIETDPPRASIMQKALIRYLRAALPQMRQASSTLGQETNLIRNYLELLKLRIEERLEFDIQIPGELASAVFPPMVLQSLVENAIKHGIEPKPEGGRVSVTAEIIDGQLRVDVKDTGVGLPDGDIFGRSGNGNGTGLGLDNIRNRLALLYPGAYSMELRSGKEGGTLVRIRIPYQPESRTDRASNGH